MNVELTDILKTTYECLKCMAQRISEIEKENIVNENINQSVANFNENLNKIEQDLSHVCDLSDPSTDSGFWSIKIKQIQVGGNMKLRCIMSDFFVLLLRLIIS